MSMIINIMNLIRTIMTSN